jgi:hypothetical protein
VAKFENKLSILVRAKQDEIEKQTGKRPSQSDIAFYMDVAPSTLSAYITNKRFQIDVRTWQAMVDYFGVPGHELFDVLPDDEA